MPSKIRPELVNGDGSKTELRGGTAYLTVYEAVKQQKGLIHGRLDNSEGEHCALGSFFDINRNATVSWDLVNEIATVNDSVPHMTRAARKRHVTRWLRWKLYSCGFMSKPRGVTA